MIQKRQTQSKAKIKAAITELLLKNQILIALLFEKSLKRRKSIEALFTFITKISMTSSINWPMKSQGILKSI